MLVGSFSLPSWYLRPAAIVLHSIHTLPQPWSSTPHTSPPSSPTSEATDASQVSSATIDAIQTVNIRSPVPVVLELTDPNFSNWRMFFDSALGKFGLDTHSALTPVLLDRGSTWYKVDRCIINWMNCTRSSEVLRIVRQRSKTDAFTLWTAITNLLHDNQLQHVIFYEAEFRNLYQGDMSITDYCTKLKTLSDNLHNVGQPVSELSQVLNMLHGINMKYRHAISAITSRQPPHTFLSARSHLLMEELFDTQRAATIAHHALFARQSGTPPHAPTPAAPSGSKSSGSGGGGKNNTNKNSGSSSDSTTGGAKSGSPAPSALSAPWRPTYNPWTSMVQAWAMPFHALCSGVLGLRPGIQAQHAMYASPDQGCLLPSTHRRSWRH
jgi:hypothetical protein